MHRPRISSRMSITLDRQRLFMTPLSDMFNKCSGNRTPGEQLDEITTPARRLPMSEKTTRDVDKGLSKLLDIDQKHSRPPGHDDNEDNTRHRRDLTLPRLRRTKTYVIEQRLQELARSSEPNRIDPELSAAQIEDCHVESYSGYNEPGTPGGDEKQGDCERYSTRSEPEPIWLWRLKRTLSPLRQANDGASIARHSSKDVKSKRSKHNGPDSNTNGNESTSDEDGPADSPSKDDDHVARRQPISDGGGGPSTTPSLGGSDRSDNSSNQGPDTTSGSSSRRTEKKRMKERIEVTLFSKFPSDQKEINRINSVNIQAITRFAKEIYADPKILANAIGQQLRDIAAIEQPDFLSLTQITSNVGLLSQHLGVTTEFAVAPKTAPHGVDWKHSNVTQRQDGFYSLLEKAGGADYLEKPPPMRDTVNAWNEFQRKIAGTDYRSVQKVYKNCRHTKAELSGIETTFAYRYKPSLFFGPIDLATQSIYIEAESILVIKQLNRNQTIHSRMSENSSGIDLLENLCVESVLHKLGQEGNTTLTIDIIPSVPLVFRRMRLPRPTPTGQRNCRIVVERDTHSQVTQDRTAYRVYTARAVAALNVVRFRGRTCQDVRGWLRGRNQHMNVSVARTELRLSDLRGNTKAKFNKAIERLTGKSSKSTTGPFNELTRLHQRDDLHLSISAETIAAYWLVTKSWPESHSEQVEEKHGTTRQSALRRVNHADCNRSHSPTSSQGEKASTHSSPTRSTTDQTDVSSTSKSHRSLKVDGRRMVVIDGLAVSMLSSRKSTTASTRDNDEDPLQDDTDDGEDEADNDSDQSAFDRRQSQDEHTSPPRTRRSRHDSPHPKRKARGRGRR